MLGARKWCREQLKMPEPIECEIANYLFSQSKVIGGNKEALDFIELNYKEFDILKLKRLSVSGAFHTRLMQSAEEPLKKALQGVQVNRPLIKFFSNYEANICSSPEKIKRNLVKQVSSPVKWEQILNMLYYDKNLPTSDEDEEHEVVELDTQETRDKTTPKQTAHRIYPDIYECGTGSHSGPILKIINRKAHQFYKHIGV
jgi:acyl transferase domain-containing protein